MPNRHILLAASLVFAACLLVGPALAQQTETIATLRISLWPEFDQPSVLVFYTGEVRADAVLPVDLRFPLPEGASVNAVAYRSESGQLVNAPFTVEDATLRMTSPNGSFHVEFYDTTLQIDGQTRHYTLTWASMHPVESLIWEVQQPAGAGNLTLTPGMSTLHKDEFGLNLYRREVGAVEAGEIASIILSYDKPIPALTVEQLQGTASVPPRSKMPWGWIAVAAVAAVTAVAAAELGAMLYRRRRQGKAAPEGPATEEEDTSSAAGEGDDLTEREIEVLKLVAEGLVNRQIGERLGISPKTAARHRENIMRKLHLHSRTDLVKYAIQKGLIDIDS